MRQLTQLCQGVLRTFGSAASACGHVAVENVAPLQRLAYRPTMQPKYDPLASTCIAACQLQLQHSSCALHNSGQRYETACLQLATVRSCSAHSEEGSTASCGLLLGVNGADLPGSHRADLAAADPARSSEHSALT